MYKQSCIYCLIKGQGGPMNLKKTVLISLALGGSMVISAGALAATASSYRKSYLSHHQQQFQILSDTFHSIFYEA